MRASALVIVLCGLTFFVGLHRPTISDSDEAYYAEAGREMLETGDWLTPQYSYEPRFQKPVFFYWLVAGTYTLTGVGEGAARFWSAMSGLGLALLTMTCAARWYNARTGAMAGLITASSFGYAAVARLALPDLPLAFFISVSIWAALRGNGDDDVVRRGRWLAVAAFAAGLAVLTKGPVGIALSIIVVGPIVWLERSWRRIPAMQGVLALVVFLVVAAPWYLLMAFEHGWTYVTGFFIGDNLERFATSRFNDLRAPWYYLPILFAGMLPWSLLAGPVWSPLLRLIRRRRALHLIERRLLLWAAIPLAFYTISIGKQPRYILPILPPLAILLARGIVTALDRDAATRKEAVPLFPEPSRAKKGGPFSDGLTIGGIAAGLLFLLMAFAIYFGRVLLVGTDPRIVVAGALAIGVGGALLMILSLTSARRHLPLSLALITALAIASLQYTVFPPRERDPTVLMAREVLAHHRPGVYVGGYRVLVRNLIFYTHLPQEDLYSERRMRDLLALSRPMLCVIAEDDLRQLERTSDLRLRRLASVVYFNASLAKPRTLISPDRDRDVQKIWLVANY